MPITTLEFDNLINESTQVGDLVYFITPNNLGGGFDGSNSSPTIVGVITKVVNNYDNPFANPYIEVETEYFSEGSNNSNESEEDSKLCRICYKSDNKKFINPCSFHTSFFSVSDNESHCS